jgi:hypothetical protein
MANRVRRVAKKPVLSALDKTCEARREKAMAALVKSAMLKPPHCPA